MNNDIDLTLNEREATHGDFSDVASVAQSLKISYGLRAVLGQFNR